MDYAHRNGEPEPPTIEGLYWFAGSFGEEKTEQFVLATVRIIEDALWYPPDECKGKWWGPIPPPAQEAT